MKAAACATAAVLLLAAAPALGMVDAQWRSAVLERPHSVELVGELPPGATRQDVLAMLEVMEAAAQEIFAADEDDLVHLLGSLGMMEAQRTGEALQRHMRPMLLRGPEGRHGPGSRAGHGARHHPLGGACHADIKKLCPPQVRDREGQAGSASAVPQCLLENINNIQPRCAATLANHQVLCKCHTDISSFCSRVEPGFGRLHQCLLEHRSDLSEPCAGFFLSRPPPAQTRVHPHSEHHSHVQGAGSTSERAHFAHMFWHHRHIALIVGLVGSVAAFAVLAIRRYRRSAPKAPTAEKEQGPDAVLSEMGYQPLLL